MSFESLASALARVGNPVELLRNPCDARDTYRYR